MSTAFLVFLVVFYLLLALLTYALARSKHVEPDPLSVPLALGLALVWPALVVLGAIVGLAMKADRR